MRRRTSLLVLLVTFALIAGSTAAGALDSFVDDNGSVHEPSINAVAAAGITLGCNPPVNDRFCPTRPVTRAEMASFLVRALSLPAASPTGFVDTAGSVHEATIDALAAAGITYGCNPPDNTRFCPTDPVTRGQMAAFLVRALGYADDGGGDRFVDDDDSVFAGDIDRLATAGVTYGCNPPGNDRYCPDQPVTREQMASFLTRALHLEVVIEPATITVTADQELAGVPIGTSESSAVAQLTALFGTPTADTPQRCPYFLADPNMRHVSWGSLTAAFRVVAAGSQPLGFVGWRYKLDPDLDPEPGGPTPAQFVLPYGTEFLDPIGEPAAASGGTVETTPFTFIVLDLDDYVFEAPGITVDLSAPVDGIQQGFGWSCE